MASLTAVWSRVFAVLGRVSMYRLVSMALSALALIALLFSVVGLISVAPLDLVVTLLVLAAVCAVADAAAQRVMHLPWRIESSLITALILLFVLRPTVEPLPLVGVAIAGAVASLSKYVLAWRGRHIFNPAATGAAVLAIVSIWLPQLGSPAWWVGTPAMAVPVIIAGLAVLWRTEKVRMIALFLVVAIVVAFARNLVQYQQADLAIDAGTILWQILWSSPFLFLGAFMLSEPLTMPPRRWQQLTVAAVVGVLAGWPIDLGAISLGFDRALLIGNLVAFAFALRTAVRLNLERRTPLTRTVQELTFRVQDRLSFLPGQYVELEVPHHRPDARGTRREFSIASAPEELPTLRIAFREAPASPGAPVKQQSSYKKALAEVPAGGALAVTGVWGDFVLPKKPDSPVLMVAAGIGVTPFVSQLRHLHLSQASRDVVLVYVASDSSELSFREELEETGVPVRVFTRDEPRDLPPHWEWSGGTRLDAEVLQRVVPDLHARHAYVSGPPGLIADLAPALERARSITTDAFSGY